MKERGMIFTGEMVRAILDDRKTQTRRMLTPRILKMIDVAADVGECYPLESGCQHKNSKSYYREWCPFGDVGDRIWVRETWSKLGNEDGCGIDWNGDLVKAGGKDVARIYRASCEQKPGNYGLWSIPNDAPWKPHTDDMDFEGPWIPSIHMPRWASRITLEITDVRVERLQAISEEDAKKEGVQQLRGGFWKHYQPEWTQHQLSARGSFATLWKSIYGDDSWKTNPWVWAIDFRRVEGGAA